MDRKKLIALLSGIALVLVVLLAIAQPGLLDGILMAADPTGTSVESTLPTEGSENKVTAPTDLPKPTEPAPTQPKPTEPAPTQPKPTEPAPTQPKPTEPAPTQPKPTESAPTQPKPTEPAPTQPPKPTEPTPTQPKPTEPPIDRDGTYTSKEDVALYIHIYGCLPDNFITKREAQELGWKSGGLDKYAYGKCIGGDRFGNREGLLPKKSGRTYTECDIDTLHRNSRGSKRIVFSNDGLIYYTDDHYESFVLLYGEP